MKKYIKEYWDVFWANADTNKRERQAVSGTNAALLLMTVFTLILFVVNLSSRHYHASLATGALCVVFIVTLIVSWKTNAQAVAMSVCVVAVVAVFTGFAVSGDNNGFAVLGIMPATMFLMAAVGVRVGMLVGIYFQILFMVLYWTPVRTMLPDNFTEIFLNRFPLLYLCTVIVSCAIILVQKKQRIRIDRHQEELEKAVRDEREKVAQISIQTIATIGRLVDAKDQYTDEHSLRVARYASLIAEEMGWDKRSVDRLYHAALLHDIGKVGIEDNILKKPARLNDEEYRIMQGHTSIGASILRELSFLESVEEGALYHHERYDGTGYPFGLQGESIPLNARIVCLADAFDAMSSDRVYRKRYDVGYVLKEIEENRGVQFDPDVVDAFTRCVEKKKILLTEDSE